MALLSGTLGERRRAAEIVANHNHVSAKELRRLVVQMLPGGHPSLSRAARALGISSRTLQRRLAEAGLCYSVLLDEARFERARCLFENPGERLCDIAAALGYADAGSFTRAFERWAGMSPRDYRKNFSNGSNVVQNRRDR